MSVLSFKDHKIRIDSLIGYTINSRNTGGQRHVMASLILKGDVKKEIYWFEDNFGEVAEEFVTKLKKAAKIAGREIIGEEGKYIFVDSISCYEKKDGVYSCTMPRSHGWCSTVDIASKHDQNVIDTYFAKLEKGLDNKSPKGR